MLFFRAQKVKYICGIEGRPFPIMLFLSVTFVLFGHTNLRFWYVVAGSMQKLDSGLDWTLDWTLDSMYFSAYRPCHHKYSPSFASTSVLRRFCTLACIVFWLSKPAKAGLCFPKHALIIMHFNNHNYYQGTFVSAELPVRGGGGGGGGGHCMHA